MASDLFEGASMILPKDLLVDLESGDRTAEHLEAKEIHESNIQNLAQQFQGLNSWNYQAGLQNQMGSSLIGQAAHQHYIGGLTSNAGGIMRW